MRSHTYLGEFELMVLLTILRLGDEAYGVPLARELAIMRGSEVSVGSVYATLDRLEIKGLIASSLGESTPERGGRAKRYFLPISSRCSAAMSSTWMRMAMPGAPSPWCSLRCRTQPSRQTPV